MNLTKMKKKKGFTLIELMAVIAIIAILAAVLVPTVSGYITRSKKTAVITQVSNVITAIETHNVTASTAISSEDTTKISALSSIISPDLLDSSNVTKVQEMTVKQAYALNKDADAINKIVLDSSTGNFASISTATP